ncbi:MAG: DUF952 domain-containing protein [Rhodomicrobium sp.]|nr:DUF952 domain-containing protein [Rhodomicrobium sp.]
MPAETIYKLMTRAEWEAAQGEGVYRGSAHDKRDGFIHFSTAAQLAETARKHFSGVNDLVLLAVDAEALNGMGEGAATASLLPGGEGQDEGSSPLRWEPSRGGDLFPHLYAVLPIAAGKSAMPIPLGEDGTPFVPAGLVS